MRIKVAAFSALLIVGCQAPTAVPVSREPVNPAPGLVELPCGATGPIGPVNDGYCDRQRHYVTEPARAALVLASERVAQRHPGARTLYMSASWPQGKTPMPPHRSHGDGRQIDLAMFYETRDGRALSKPPTPSGYGAFEPPRNEAERVCVPDAGHHDKPDPSAGRTWRLDEARTAELVGALSADPRVRRIFIEPHLKARLGFKTDPKVRFAGCNAARHDDHLHVDFH